VKIRSGFRVYGLATTGHHSYWYFATFDEAKRFCEIIAQDTGEEYDILGYLGSVRRVPTPTEFIPADKP
jgi:hypothetical protein